MELDPPLRPSIRRLGPSDLDCVMAAAHLFDDAPQREWTARFLSGRDCLLFFVEIGGRAVGFLKAIEIVHPDKAPERRLHRRA